MIRGAQPGSDRLHRSRRRRPSGRCLSPGCAEEASGGRFCAAHQAVLDRVRVEYEAELASGEAAERMLRKSTRGMSRSRWEAERGAEEDADAEAVAEALGARRRGDGMRQLQEWRNR